MAETLTLRIVTPERQLLDQKVEEIVAPGAEGEVGILPEHITFLTTLAPGRLVYTTGGRREAVAIFGGYAEVRDNIVTVLADGAEAAATIDAEAARAALSEAEAQLGNLEPGTPEHTAAQQQYDQASARLAAVQ